MHTFFYDLVRGIRQGRIAQMEAWWEGSNDLTKYLHENLPPYMEEGVKGWILFGTPPGDFLKAVFANKLKESFARADQYNIKCIAEWAQFVYWHAPSGASKDARVWTTHLGLFGLLPK